MTAEELLGVVRSLVRDTEPDYLFTDVEIYGAMANAQDEMAIDSEVIQREIELTFLTGSDSVTLPEFVLRPLRAKVGNDVHMVLNVDAPRPAPGLGIYAFYHDLGVLYISPTPASDIPVNVKAVCLPESQPSESNQTLEIPERLHYALATGTAYYLTRTLDADMEDERRLRSFFSSWQNYLKEARRYAALHNRTQRTTRYGGLPHGQRTLRPR